MIRVSAFKWVPPFAQGHVRDLRVRWALEEAVLPYEQWLIGHGERDTPAYRAAQPFGQVPVFEEDGVTLFESGAIVLHVAARSEALLPSAPAERAKATMWLIAALNSVEPSIQSWAENEHFEKDERVREARRPKLVAAAAKRLDALAGELGDREYLIGRFTCADILMATVLRIVDGSELIARRPGLAAYLARCEARPAFRTALADQLAVYAANTPAG